MIFNYYKLQRKQILKYCISNGFLLDKLLLWKFWLKKGNEIEFAHTHTLFNYKMSIK